MKPEAEVNAARALVDKPVWVNLPNGGPLCGRVRAVNPYSGLAWVQVGGDSRPYPVKSLVVMGDETAFAPYWSTLGPVPVTAPQRSYHGLALGAAVLLLLGAVLPIAAKWLGF